MSIPECPDNWCVTNRMQLDEYCHDLDYPAGRKIIIMLPPNKPCWCICGCMAGNMTIATPEATVMISTIEAGKTLILTAGLDLAWKPVVVRQWAYLAAETGTEVIYLFYHVDGEQLETVITRDRLFLLSDGTIKPADKLAPGDCLVDRNGEPVPILDIAWGDYWGELCEIETNSEYPDERLESHLLIGNGVVIADFMVQVFQSIETSHIGRSLKNARSLPSVGSPKWIEHHESGYQEMIASRQRRRLDPKFSAANPDSVVIPEYASE